MRQDANHLPQVTKGTGTFPPDFSISGSSISALVRRRPTKDFAESAYYPAEPLPCHNLREMKVKEGERGGNVLFIARSNSAKRRVGSHAVSPLTIISSRDNVAPTTVISSRDSGMGMLRRGSGGNGKCIGQVPVGGGGCVEIGWRDGEWPYVAPDHSSGSTPNIREHPQPVSSSAPSSNVPSHLRVKRAIQRDSLVIYKVGAQGCLQAHYPPAGGEGDAERTREARGRNWLAVPLADEGCTHLLPVAPTSSPPQDYILGICTALGQQAQSHATRVPQHQAPIQFAAHRTKPPRGGGAALTGWAVGRAGSEKDAGEGCDMRGDMQQDCGQQQHTTQYCGLQEQMTQQQVSQHFVMQRYEKEKERERERERERDVARRAAAQRLLDDPVAPTNTLSRHGDFLPPTPEQRAKALRCLREHFRGSEEDMRALKAKLNCARARRGLAPDAKIAVVTGGNKAVKASLEKIGYTISDKESDVDLNVYQIKWALAHADIDFKDKLANQMTNHFPNTACELGAKVGLHRNLRSLEWFDNSDMDDFLPRMFNCANPWEMQDFVEDFFFTAAAIEVVRHSQGLPPTWRGASQSQAARRRVLAASCDMCTRFLDNKMALKGRGGKLREQGKVEGVLGLRDYYRIRPDLEPPARDREGAEREGGELAEEGNQSGDAAGWVALEESKVKSLMSEMHARLQCEHRQLYMDGLRNVWIVKPGHGTRGHGIRCYDNLKDIISCASKRGGGKRSVVVQKYVEPCLLLEGGRKFDIRAWVLVTNWNPLTVWMYEPYFRVCTEEHSLDKKSLSNHYKHLCNRCVQAKSQEYDDGDEIEGGCMWSVDTMAAYLDKFGNGAEIWGKIRRQMMDASMKCMHSVQDLIDNKAGCFEWFGLDFMVDERFDVWLLECNISPDMSRGTEVLERLVPTALVDLWDMLLKPKDAQGGWDLVFKGKEISKDVLQKRFWRRKNLMTDLRAGRPFAQREALCCKLGASTNSFLQLTSAAKSKVKEAKQEGGGRKNKKQQEDKEDEDEDEDEQVDDQGVGDADEI